MNMAIFLVIFAILEVITPLVTEALKKFLDSINKTYVANVLVLVDSMAVTVAVMLFYYLANGIQLTMINIFYIIFMFAANWLGSMLGYDKVKQALAQIQDKSNE